MSYYITRGMLDQDGDMKVDVADNAQFYSTFDWKAGVVLPKFLSDRYEKEARLRNFECHVVGAE
jgi:hypothetical protein